MNLSGPGDPVTITNLPYDANGNILPARVRPNNAGFGQVVRSLKKRRRAASRSLQKLPVTEFAFAGRHRQPVAVRGRLAHQWNRIGRPVAHVRSAAMDDKPRCIVQ